MVGHVEALPATATLEQVHRRFAESARDFLAILDGGRLLGVCARREVAMKLGARFGFALFAASPVREHMMTDALVLEESLPLPDALRRVSERSEERFYDDVLVVDDAGRFVGFIFVHALVRLQTRLLLGNIAALESSRQEIAERSRAMEDDLTMAREVQIAMLPCDAGDADPGARLRFHSVYAPAGGVSGDFFQLIRISDSCAGLLVCDVMGHGVRSALVTAMLRAFAEDLRPQAHEPGLLLTRLNRALMGVLRQTGNLLFVTAAYVVMDMETRRLLYGQAGHPTGFVLRASSGAADLLPVDDEVSGPALGLIEEFSYVTGTTPIEPGDRAILFTDGIYEARNAEGDEWGQDRLRAVFARHADRGCPELLSTVMEAVKAFGGGGAFEDDVCLVSLEAAP